MFGGCCWCADMCDCCAHELFVEAPPGTVIGSVRQTGDLCTYNYQIKDAEGNVQLLINGPCMICECCADIEFPVGAAVFEDFLSYIQTVCLMFIVDMLIGNIFYFILFVLKYKTLISYG